MQPSNNIPKKIFLYITSREKIDTQEILKFITENFGKIKIEVKKKDFVKTKGLLFDSLRSLNTFKQTIADKFRTLDYCHIAITDRLISTYDEYLKIHIRSSVFGYPSVISTSGIVEGPAKPREFYVFKQRYTTLSVWELQETKIKSKFKPRFIDYGDRRLTEVLKGCIAQALFFFITGEPFCKDKSCRLFNSHWQEDLIYSQIKSGKFCKKHKGLLNIIRKET